MALTTALDRFSRGYLLRPYLKRCEATEHWQSIELHNNYVLQHHPRTLVTKVGSAFTTIVVVGRAYDVDDQLGSSAEVATAILNKIDISGWQAGLRYIAYLGGRFVVFVSTDRLLRAIPDCAATYALHYNKTDGGLFAASHWMLTAEASEATENVEAIDFMNSAEYSSPAGKYYPGTWTPYTGVSPLFANCFLSYLQHDFSVSQERFYPFTELRGRGESECQTEFEDRLIACSKFSLSDAGNVLALTGGGDSQTVLTALKASGDIDLSEIVAATYIKQENTDHAQLEDVLVANRSAFDQGMQHLVFPVKPIDFASDFHKKYSASFRRGARYPSLARAYNENLPVDSTVLISMVAEIGTVFYSEREQPEPTPEALASKFTQSVAKNNHSLINCMNDYIELTQFKKDAFFNYDWHDLFYWEHRNTKWASLGHAEVDLTGFAIVPYNDRRLIEIMLSVPTYARRDKVLQREFRRKYS